jgi:hypothetical protein
MTPAGLEPIIPASERPQTHALDCGPLGLANVRMLVHTVEPRFTNAPVHEQIFRAKNVSDGERCLGLLTRKLATAASREYRRGSQLLVNFGSVHIPACIRRAFC